MNEIFNIHQEKIKYEESTNTCYNMDEPQKHQVKKVSHKDHIPLWFHSYENLE